MDHQSSFGLQQFKNHVAIKFQLYNSLFTSLPFHRIEKTGILLSLLLTNCEEGYKKKMSPEEIIEDFFNRHTSYRNEQEKQVIEAAIKQLTDTKKYKDKIATQVIPFTTFYPAEDYHQEYISHHPDNPYVQNVSIPDYLKFRKDFKGEFKQ